MLTFLEHSFSDVKLNIYLDTFFLLIKELSIFIDFTDFRSTVHLKKKKRFSFLDFMKRKQESEYLLRKVPAA